MTAVWEGAVAIRRAVFDEVGGWPEEFRFVHEGIDLAWRVMDAGYRVEYAGEIGQCCTPSRAAVPGASRLFALLRACATRSGSRAATCRCRSGVMYASSFALRRAVRVRSAGDARALAKGLRDGMREPCGTRRPLSARTIWRMTRAGRPPVI